MRLTRAFFTILLVISTLLVHLGNGRSITQNYSVLSTLSDDGNNIINHQTEDDNVDLKATTVTCEPIYGFLPCATTFWGLLFMIVVYEVLLSFGEQYVSAGSDLFFETFGTGIFGASLFHLLGALPQVGLILVTGITASSDTIEEQAKINMALLAGKAIMSLTLTWGLVVAFGSHDLSLPPTTAASDLEQDTKPFTLTGYGVTSDIETSKTARIMLVSLIPFLILQLAKILKSSSGIRVVVLVAFIVTLGLLLSYFIYQIFQPWIQNRRLEFVLRKYIRRNLLQNLLTAGRRPNVPVIREVFHRLDKNSNLYISISELRALVVGMQIEEESGLHRNDLVAKVLEQFDTSQDHQINEQEFVTGISNWLIGARDSIRHSDRGIIRKNSKETTTEEQQSLLTKKVPNNGAANDKDWLNYINASLLIILGTAMLVALGRPLVNSVVGLSFAVNIPSFLISYVVIPLALNYKQALRAISSAKQKTDTALSLMLSEIYNGVFMNNMMGLIAFLGLVYIRNASWDVSAEVLVVLIICTLMGFYTSFTTTFPVWTSIVAFLLYPTSLLFLYVLTSVLGWS